jgi:hypothetical protein
MPDIFSALWLADSVGSFFAEGGALYVHSPIEPSSIEHGCQGYAIWGNVLTDREGKIICYTAFYHVGRMINEEWVTHRSGMHHLYSVDVGIEDAAGNALVTSYAVRRPNGIGRCCLSTKIERMRSPFESRLKAVAGPDIFPAQFAWSHLAANNTFGTARTPPLKPIQICRL